MIHPGRPSSFEKTVTPSSLTSKVGSRGSMPYGATHTAIRMTTELTIRDAVKPLHSQLHLSIVLALQPMVGHSVSPSYHPCLTFARERNGSAQLHFLLNSLQIYLLLRVSI